MPQLESREMRAQADGLADGEEGGLVDSREAPAALSRPVRHTLTTGGRAGAVLLALLVAAACGAGTTRGRVETPASMTGYRAIGGGGHR
jgi:hypothetical protein